MIGLTNQEIDVLKCPEFTLGSLYRNALINSNFDVWQRGTSFNQPGQSVYTTDRWKSRHNMDTNVKVLQSTDVPPNGLSKYSIRLEQYYANGTNTDCYTNLVQLIEDYEKFKGKKVTVSFFAKCDDATSNNLCYLDYDTAISEVKYFKGDGTWKFYSYTFTVPSTITMLGVTLRFTRTSQPIGKGINFSQVQLNVGDIALPYQPRTFDEELRMCMRYYEKSYNYTRYAGNTGDPDAVLFYVYDGITTNSEFGFMPFRVAKRVSPSITLYSKLGTKDMWSASGGVDFKVTPTYPSEYGFHLTNMGSVAINYHQYQHIYGHWVADAEM